MRRPSPVLSSCPPRPARTVALPSLAFALAATLGLGGCAGDRDSTSIAGARADSAGVAILAVVPVGSGGEGDASFEGFLDPVIDAVVPARTGGVLREVRVREGAQVKRGDVLARLEDEEQRLEVEYNGALAEQAAAELERAEKGAAGQFVSRQSLDAARAKARATRVDHDLAKIAYARRTLRAPVSGVVWQVRAEPHRLVAAQDILFRVTDPSRLRVDVNLPGAWFRRVRVGDAVRLLPTSEPGAEPLAGRVASVSPLVDPSTGRFHVAIEADAGGRALAGQTVRAEFGATPAKDPASAIPAGAAILPREALLERRGDELAVWVVRDGTVRRVAVELGASRPDGFEVNSGLRPGDLVAARGAVPPADGAPVRTRLVAAGD